MALGFDGDFRRTKSYTRGRFHEGFCIYERGFAVGPMRLPIFLEHVRFRCVHDQLTDDMESVSLAFADFAYSAYLAISFSFSACFQLLPSLP